MIPCARCSKPIRTKEDLKTYSFLRLLLPKPYHRKCYDEIKFGFRIPWEKVYPVAFVAWVLLVVVLIAIGEQAPAAFALFLLALAVVLWIIERLYVRIKFEDKLE